MQDTWESGALICLGQVRLEGGDLPEGRLSYITVEGMGVAVNHAAGTHFLLPIHW